MAQQQDETDIIAELLLAEQDSPHGNDDGDEDSDSTEDSDEDDDEDTRAYLIPAHSLPTYSFSKVLGWTPEQWAKNANAPCRIGTCIGLTKNWDHASSNTPERQWETLLAPFFSVSEPNLAWRSITLASHKTQNGQNDTLYLLVTTPQGPLMLFVYHFASDSDESIGPITMLFRKDHDPNMAKPNRPLFEAWEACKPLCQGLFRMCGTDTHALPVQFSLLPRMAHPAHYYVMNLLARHLSGKEFENTLLANEPNEASRALTTLFCDAKLTEWFSAKPADITQNAAWRAPCHIAQVPLPATEPPSTAYLFSKDNVAHGIPPSILFKGNEHYELLLLMFDWLHAKTVPNFNASLQSALREDDKLNSSYDKLHAALKSLLLAHGLASTNPIYEHLHALLIQLLTDQAFRVAHLAGEVAALFAQTPKAIASLLFATKLAKSAGDLYDTIIAFRDTLTRATPPTLTEKDLQTAEGLAKKISLLVFELSFHQLFLKQKMLLVFHTALHPDDLHQIRHFFVACQLIATELRYSREQENPRLQAIPKALQQVSQAQEKAQARLDALAQQYASAAAKSSPEEPPPPQGLKQHEKIATALLELHKESKRPSTAEAPQMTMATIYTRVKAILMRLTSSAAHQAQTKLEAACDAAAAEHQTLPLSQQKKSVWYAFNTIRTKLLKKMGSSSSQLLQGLDGAFVLIATYFHALLTIELLIEKRLALLEEEKKLKEKLPGFDALKQWETELRKLKFSMSEAPAAGSTNVTTSLSIMHDSPGRHKIKQGEHRGEHEPVTGVQRSNVRAYAQERKWLAFIDLLRDMFLTIES